MSSYVVSLLIASPLIFFSAFCDSVAGGGGLISIPAYTLAGLPFNVAVATNKLSTAPSSILSSLVYSKYKKVNWEVVLFALVPIIIFASFGAYVATIVPNDFFRIFLLSISLPLLALIIFKDKIKVKKNTEVKNSKTKILIVSILIGAIIGFYDGFYGPGTGIFLTLSLMFFLDFEPTNATGTARVLNALSGIFSLIQFIIIGGMIDYKIGSVCLVAGLLGSYTGSKLAIKKGARIIKPIMIFVILLMFFKLLLEQLNVISF